MCSQMAMGDQQSNRIVLGSWSSASGPSSLGPSTLVRYITPSFFLSRFFFFLLPCLLSSSVRLVATSFLSRSRGAGTLYVLYFHVEATVWESCAALTRPPRNPLNLSSILCVCVCVRSIPSNTPVNFLFSIHLLLNSSDQSSFVPKSVLIVPQIRSISPTARYRLLATHLIRIPLQTIGGAPH